MTDLALQVAREPLGILHTVLTEIARRFVLLEVHASASEQAARPCFFSITPGTCAM